MSKAFTRESDDAPAPAVGRRPLALPPDTANYLTPEGARRLRAELDALVAGGAPESARRIEELTEHLDSAEIVDPTTQPQDEVRFGATVTVADDEGREATYRIVGLAEAEPRAGAISWQSPLARALLGARVGDVIARPTPKGPEDVEVVAIGYPAG